MSTYLCVLVFAGAVFGQEVGVIAHGQVRVMPQGDQEKLRHAQEIGFASIIGAEVMPGRPVTGAPYTADTVTEFTQVLADGTRIQNSSSGMMARDSEGRTRRERVVETFGVLPADEKLAVVIITDPVTGFSYTLNTREKVATKIALPRMVGHQEAITVTHTAAGGGAFAVRLPPRGLGEGKKESLGTRVIEGVQAEGTRTVTVIPAGAMGNDRPIEIVAERWFSPQLQTVVLSRHSDPRSGENTFRLVNIIRSEPSRTLFEVPPDYTVREGGKVMIEKIQREEE